MDFFEKKEFRTLEERVAVLEALRYCDKHPYPIGWPTPDGKTTDEIEQDHLIRLKAGWYKTTKLNHTIYQEPKCPECKSKNTEGFGFSLGYPKEESETGYQRFYCENGHRFSVDESKLKKVRWSYASIPSEIQKWGLF